MLAITHTCIYDAWSAYDGIAVGTQLRGKLRRPSAERTDANKKEALSYAAHTCLKDLFPSQTEYFDAILSGLGFDPGNNSADPASPAGIGHLAARAVIRFRHADGSNQLGDMNPGAYSDYTGYAPVNTPDQINDPNRWQPLRVPDGKGGFIVQKFIAPHWEKVVPFALVSADQFDADVAPPAMFPSQEYRKQVRQIIDYSAKLTDEHKAIAEYWADGPASETPPGHWGLFAQFVSARDSHNIDQDTKMFFALHNAIFDAGIVSWHLKRNYDYVRPITAVRFLRQGKMIRAWGGPGKGTMVIKGEDWNPYQPATFPTPPFPEYSSGHSVFSRTGAEILRMFTSNESFGGSVTVRAGSSLVEPGLAPSKDVTLSWPTFKDAADQAGLSRRYGGIHFNDGDENARVLGPQIAEQAWEKAQKLFAGKAR
ncbi:MAG: vanadium-dependent haloperoxidase [Burkholderiales bacterium]|nr:vanadium-dependent haloperoxidase [Burkholderiales bacterium]